MKRAFHTLLAGRIHMAMSSVSSMSVQIRAGKLRVLAVSGCINNIAGFVFSLPIQANDRHEMKCAGPGQLRH